MALKWTGSQSESGILRKSELKEKKEDLFVFGYSCKLFRDDDRALHIDQGKHLIPWMGDETLKIDRGELFEAGAAGRRVQARRLNNMVTAAGGMYTATVLQYDARGALHELTALEAPSGGFDVRMELTRAELDVEQLCDEERYRALHTDEDEEEMYKEEELKRLHAAGYGQVGFNYDTPEEPSPPQIQEVDEPFVPSSTFKAMMPFDTIFPEGLKQNAIIEKTANFIASQGAQMEILIKAKQRDNPQFEFLNRESNLHPYYVALTALIKAGKWPEKKVEVVEEKPPENEEYLHPSLASTIIESAPAIPSIHYRPSADCDYTMLISKFKGAEDNDDAHGDVPPPGTEAAQHAQIYKPPVMYTKGPDGNYVDPTAAPAAPAPAPQYAAYYHQYLAQEQAKTRESTPTLQSTGLSLMKNYNTDSDSDDTDSDSTDSGTNIPTPPEDIQIVIDKMAAYVARNGDEFADIVRARNDPRFTFLEPNDVYHPYYRKLMQQKRGEDNRRDKKDKTAAPVSFSIKKLKEPDPILPKPALPYESSSEDESDKTDKQNDKEEINETPKAQLPNNYIPPPVVYKMDGQFNNDLPIVKTIEPIKHAKKVLQDVTKEEKATEKLETNINTVGVVDKRKENAREKENPYKRDKESPLKRDSPFVRENNSPAKRDKQSPIPRQNDNYSRENSVKRDKSPKREKDRSKDKKGDRESPYKDRGYSKDKKKHHRKREYRSKSETRDSKRRRSVEREKKEKSKRSKINDDLENEIISLEDNSDEMIVDLTGDQSDTKECETEAEKAKQLERRRRAAEFLKHVGVDPAAAALPTSSLASAMVDTLESLRKKKAEEEKRRRREKRRHRERHEEDDRLRKSKRRKYKSSDDNESDYDSSKKKKRKKDRKHSSKTKKKNRREVDEQEDIPLPSNIDLTNTLKELRTSSPTKQLTQEIEEVHQESSEESTRGKKRKKERDYSEGEWSSDSEGDSKSSVSDED